jgi:hypothetical protein
MGADFCKKCGVSFFEVMFKPYWYTVFAGLLIGFLALHILYAVLGTKHVFTIGMLPIIFISCCVTYMLAYNRNIQETYDFNAVINAGITGIFLGISVLLYLLSII